MMVHFLGIFFGTFILEDVAMASSLALVADGQISPQLAMLANFLGIGIGDAALYWVGRWGQRFSNKKDSWLFKKIDSLSRTSPTRRTITISIFTSRFFPGVRLPTHLAAGFYRYSFFSFAALTSLSVFTWVVLMFKSGIGDLVLFKTHPFLSILIFVGMIKIYGWFADNIRNPWALKAKLYSWRRWRYFEFWPAWFFYAPLVPYYIFLSLKHRSFLLPFYARPESKHGGLIGESKWDFLQHLSKSDSSTLRAILIKQGVPIDQVKNQMKENGISLPCILKPDVGQRGFAVRFVEDEKQLERYFANANFDIIVQEKSKYLREAGVFYIRNIGDDKGYIFSITEKSFPTVVGDDETPLGQLILNNSRAKLIARTYFKRFEGKLNWVPTQGEIISLVNCGNHAQGAIFHDGKDLNTTKLLEQFDQIAKSIPNFYFGRFDVRYSNPDSFKQGQEFQIVEVNGAGAEATHIWDRNTSLLEAYQTLFKQWSILFEIGLQQKVHLGNIARMDFRSFFKDWIVLGFRDQKWTVSS